MHWDWDKFYNRAYDWVIMYGPRIIMAVIAFIAGMLLIRLLNRWVKRALENRHINPSVRYFLQNLVAITLQVLLIMLALQIMGVQLTFVSAIIAGLTVAIGLALSGTLQNFVSGILILILRPYRVGDNINTQGQEGTVTSIQIFYTMVLTFDNKTIIIPNGQLSNNVVINLSKEGKRRMDIDMKFNYGIDIEKAKKVMQDSAASLKSILHEPAIRAGVSLIEPDRYTITLNAWTLAHGYYDTRIELQEKLINDLKASGIKLPGM